MKIGFIGLGIMGEPMCTNIIKKTNYKVYVYDINKDSCERLVEVGAKGATSITQIGQECDVIISMVPKNEHVQMVYNELLNTAHEGQIYIDMSTISPKVSIDIANLAKQKGVVMLDAPVVKSQPAAVAGTLGIYVGGDKATYEKIHNILGCMGSNIIHLGDNGSGLLMKLCHNTLVAQIQNGVNEMMNLALKLGNIDPVTFATAISYGGGQNFYLDAKHKAIAEENYTTAFSVENMNKDVNLTLDLVKEQGITLEGVNLVVERYKEAMDKGYGKEDFCATYKVVNQILSN